MKLILILLIVSFSYSADGIRERLKNLNKKQDQIFQRQEMPLIPVEEVAKEETLEVEEQRVIPRHGDRLTRLETKQEYTDKDLEKIEKKLDETRERLIEVVTVLEKQNKIAETQTDKSARVDLILNIILGLAGFFITGGAGYFGWKKKHLVFKKLNDTQEK